MSEYELTSLVFELFRDMDSMIEFWIQATFAVVVAVFVAGNRLSQWLRRVIATLYLLASVIAALRWSVLGYRTSLYRERLLESGYRDIATSPVAIYVVTALIALMFLIAVISTIQLLLRPESAGPMRGRSERGSRHRSARHRDTAHAQVVASCIAPPLTEMRMLRQGQCAASAHVWGPPPVLGRIHVKCVQSALPRAGEVRQ